MPRIVRIRTRLPMAALCGLGLLGCEPEPKPAPPEPPSAIETPAPPKPGAKAAPSKPRVDMQ